MIHCSGGLGAEVLEVGQQSVQDLDEVPQDEGVSGCAPRTAVDVPGGEEIHQYIRFLVNSYVTIFPM